MNSHLPVTAPRRSWVRRLVNLLVALVVIAVAAATFVFSYDGVHAIALLGGMSTQLARYYPGLFDAVLVIACVTTVVLRDGRWWARAWAWVVLVVLLAAIGTTDVLHAMNYSLRHRTTEGIVAAAPVVAVLLAFSLLLTVLRQSRSHAAVDEPGDRAELRPAMPAPLAPPALPAALPADDATVETQAVTAGPAIRPPAPASAHQPIALPAGPQATPLTPPDGLPAMTRPATEPYETLPPAAPPVASQRTPEGELAPPTVSSPAVAPDLPRPQPAPPAEPAPPEPSPARPQGIRYAGSGAHGRAASASAVQDEDYWGGDDDGQFAGLVYSAREGTADSAAAPGDNSADEDGQAAVNDAGFERGGPTQPMETTEIDEDASPFATAPFATVQGLNRVRSMPVPPEDEEAE